MMHDEDTDVRASLAEIPPVPDGLYDRVKAGISRDRLVRRSALATVLGLVLAAGFWTVSLRTTHHETARAQSATEELAEEIDMDSGYLNGDDVGDVLDISPVVEIDGDANGAGE